MSLLTFISNPKLFSKDASPTLWIWVEMGAHLKWLLMVQSKNSLNLSKLSIFSVPSVSRMNLTCDLACMEGK
jgi:hypothetical protein